MSVTPERAQIYIQESSQVVENRPEVMGYLAIGDHSVLFVVEDEIDTQAREEIVKQAPNFKNVFFLTGVSPKSYEEDPSVVQRVVGYSGMLPNWKISQGTGEWHDSQDKLDTLPSIATISVVPYHEYSTKL